MIRAAGLRSFKTPFLKPVPLGVSKGVLRGSRKRMIRLDEKFGFEMVSPVYLLGSIESLWLRQPNPAQQISVAGVGAHPVPEQVYP